MTQSAFVLRIAPSQEDRVPEALSTNQLVIGWAYAEGLLDSNLTWEQFRNIVGKVYFSEEPALHKAGAAAGHLWRFIREMKQDDLIVVPYGAEFYVGTVLGPATYDPRKIKDDTAYRRPVCWLNEGKPILRQLAKSALVSRMKTQGTCTSATDLLAEINECLDLAKREDSPTFESDLQARLIREVLGELREGRVDSFKFERLIEVVMRGLGAEDTRIIPRNEDKGADIVATFLVAGTFQQRVAIQAKHWQCKPPVKGEVVEQLIRGIEANN